MKSKNQTKHLSDGRPISCTYFLGMIGAAIYFISKATGFWVGVLGFLKALVWPAFLVYELLQSAGA